MLLEKVELLLFGRLSLQQLPDGTEPIRPVRKGNVTRFFQGFGVVFATFITLMIVPVSYLILEDVKRLASRVFGKRVEGPDPIETPAVPTASSGGQP